MLRFVLTFACAAAALIASSARPAADTVVRMRVLSIVHEDSETGGGGLFERIVGERGDRLARWFTANGDDPPGDPGAWDAIMVFGGAMHPDSDAVHTWLAGETAFIESALATGVPLLGVCLGAQLVARATGADPQRVRPTTSAAFVRPAPRPAFSVLGHQALVDAGVEPIGDWRERFAAAAPSVLA